MELLLKLAPEKIQRSTARRTSERSELVTRVEISRKTLRKWASSARDRQAGLRPVISSQKRGARAAFRPDFYFTTIVGGKIVKIEGERAKKSSHGSNLSLTQIKRAQNKQKHHRKI